LIKLTPDTLDIGAGAEVLLGETPKLEAVKVKKAQYTSNAGMGLKHCGLVIYEILTYCIVR
jgi:hypothetical protein